MLYPIFLRVPIFREETLCGEVYATKPTCYCLVIYNSVYIVVLKNNLFVENKFNGGGRSEETAIEKMVARPKSQQA